MPRRFGHDSHSSRHGHRRRSRSRDKRRSLSRTRCVTLNRPVQNTSITSLTEKYEAACNQICDHQSGVAGGGAENGQKALEKKPDPPRRKGKQPPKTGLKGLANLHLPSSYSCFIDVILFPHFVSSRGKKDRKSERGRDKRDRSVSRKRSHKDEDRIKSKTKSGKVTVTCVFCQTYEARAVFLSSLFISFFFIISGGKCLQKREKGRLPKGQKGFSHTPGTCINASWPIQRQLQDSERRRRIYGNRLRQVRIGSPEKKEKKNPVEFIFPHLKTRVCLPYHNCIWVCVYTLEK